MTNRPDDFISSGPSSDGLPSTWIERLQINVPGYKLLSEIARGGQAVVYRAEQVSTGMIVAVKILHGGPLVDDPARERLRREVRALAVLNHPQIVKILDRGQTAENHEFL